MQANDSTAAFSSASGSRPQPIASLLHLAGFLLIGLAVAGLGLLAQHAQSSAPAGQLASHAAAKRFYLSAIVLDWALFYYCWVGVHRRGGSLWVLAGRWTNWKSVAVDIAVVVPFWGIWEGAAYGVSRLLGPSTAKAVDSLLPHSLIEVLLWVATCATAGICEEMVFRGYLQRQFHGFSGSAAFAVLAQGVVFGIFHGYQGWRNVVVISVLGILYGLLVFWRGNLRANIISHAWSDFWEGWLKFLVFR